MYTVATMVLFVDLDEGSSAGPCGDLDRPQSHSVFLSLEHHPHNGGPDKASANIEERPNPNSNGFAAILSCYP